MRLGSGLPPEQTGRLLRVRVDRSVPVFLALLLLLGGLVRAGHRHVEAWAPPETAADSIRFLPSGEALGVVSLGYRQVLADLLWMRCTILFGEKFGETGDDGWYVWLYHMMDLATDLDPQYRAAYKYGGILLRVNGEFVDQSSMMFAKGMHALPDEWYFPFGIAMNYFMYKDDPKMAAPYMRRAAETDGGPFYLANLAASLLDSSHGLETSLAFLQEELGNVPEGASRRAIEVKIFEVRYLIGKRDAEAVVGAFRSRTGNLPPTPSVVEQAGLTLPPDPLGGEWEWDTSPGAEIGSLRSSRYVEVFRKLSQDSGLGALGLDRSSAPAGVATDAGE